MSASHSAASPGERWRPQPWVCAGLLAIALTACRTTAPAGTESPIAPLTAGAPVVSELTARLGTLHAIRSLMRIRATTGQTTQSFRAQLLVEPSASRMELTAYTPIGTSALTLFAEGDRVVFLNHIDQTAWQGSAAELAQSVGYFDPATTPAAWALDLAGFPAGGSAEAGSAGLSRIAFGAVTMTFDPPVFPPRNVTIARGADRLDVTHLELVSTDASPQVPRIPSNYRCCVVPRL